MLKIAVVIATFGRPDELRQVMVGLSKSDLVPSKIVIVDASGEELAKKNRQIMQTFSTLPISYLTHKVGSANRQRNAGIQALDLKSYDYVQILDDDTVPSKNYLSQVMNLLEEDKALIGASGTTRSIQRRTPIQKFRSLPFVLAGLEDFRYGSLTLAGIGMPPDPQWTDPKRVEWLFGCSMWRSSIFTRITYDESLLGSCLFDDVLFSVKAQNYGELAIQPSAFLRHLLSPNQRPDEFLHYFRYSRNRWLVIKELGSITNYVYYVISVLFLGFHFFGRAIFARRESRQALIKNGLATFSGFVSALAGGDPK